MHETKDPQITDWLSQFETIKKSMLEIDPFRKGTILELYNICGKLNCRCKKDKKYRHGPYHSWSSKKKGKTVTINVPKNLLATSAQFIANAKTLDLKIAQLADLSDKIIRRKIELVRKIQKN